MSLKSVFDLVVVLVLLNLILKNYHGAEGWNNKLASKEEDMEIDEKLKTLNKPPVKSIKKKLGETYDCISIYKQPAFDHPLLRNHKIQMKPNVIQGEQIDEPIYNMVSIGVRSKYESCPSETVPIRRTTKEELYVSAQPFAEKVYYGGSAKFFVANPSVGPEKFSTTQICIQNGPAEELNSIEFGWGFKVLSIFLFNNYRLQFQADGFKDTGCYNMLCPGFIKVHPKYSFGEYIGVGLYGGIQRVFYFSVHRDPKSGNWWLIDGVDNAKIGYWPK
ncbi:uncharacterized protein LOC113312017 [Papaver somniferum]|uniref:uncharacterized protein LOC113312017 n=1 Tax=Papaver somniferum TaxID=3469 RepID=UPI000E6FCA7A|nr:uncharacterized protein LOC113312017 [Papaver somniferum]